MQKGAGIPHQCVPSQKNTDNIV